MSAASTSASSTFKPLHFLITGAGRGIGRGLSRLLIARGHRVFLVDSNGDELFHTCDIIAKSLPYPHAAATGSASETKPSAPKPLDALQCNLRQRAEIEKAASAASTFFSGHLDVLINNAGYTAGVGGPSMTAPYPSSKSSSDGPAAANAEDDFMSAWDASISTNLTAPVLLSRACLPILRADPPRRAQGGSIIHISSTRAHQSEENSEPYAATKAGLIGLTHSMAVSLAGEGVRVNTILPGWIHVGDECKAADEKGTQWEEGLSKEDQAWHLTGRVGKVDDILEAVEYLAKASFVTGTETVVDGGVTRKMVYPE